MKIEDLVAKSGSRYERRTLPCHRKTSPLWDFGKLFPLASFSNQVSYYFYNERENNMKYCSSCPRLFPRIENDSFIYRFYVEEKPRKLYVIERIKTLSGSLSMIMTREIFTCFFFTSNPFNSNDLVRITLWYHYFSFPKSQFT